MYLQSIKPVKHNAAKSVNRSILKKSRHIGFGVCIVQSSMPCSIWVGGRAARSRRSCARPRTAAQTHPGRSQWGGPHSPVQAGSGANVNITGEFWSSLRFTSVANWPIVRLRNSKRAEQNVEQQDKAAVEFWPILYRKGRKRAKLLKNKFFSSYSLQFCENQRNIILFPDTETQRTKFSSAKMPSNNQIN